MAKRSFKGSAMLNPVPCVLITSQNKDGKVNVFTVGWVGTACTRPPMITVAIRKERLSYEYILETQEFVINLPSVNLTKALDYCGVVSGKKEDKIKKLGLELENSSVVKVPSIKQCLVSIECKLRNVTELGSHDLFLAEVVSVNVDESIIDKNGKICLDRANLITYCHGQYFALKNKELGSFGYSIRKKK
jgi:flavin reductase (DIM6/NTAB) family NADH-FMN oxidoreductase RutF